MSETKSHIEVKRGSDRNFGLVFAGVFLIIAVFPMLGGESLRLWSCAISGVFLILALLAPRSLSVPNKLWFKLGMVLGAVVAPIVMVLVYFITVMPIGLIMRLSGKDLLQQRIDRNKESYWIKRAQPVGSMKDQF